LKPLSQPTAGVLTVDDDPAFLELLDAVLRATDHLESVGRTGSGAHGVELARTLHPDMVILDVRMRGLGGIEAARRIRKAVPSALVVLISTMHPTELPREGHAVADAVLWKSELAPQLLDDLWLRHRDVN
jgi:DNA-binding NarL/FixJ family response regulator